MVVERHKSLLSYNSFHIEAMADRFVSLSDADGLEEILHKDPGDPVLVLGGGSSRCGRHGRGDGQDEADRGQRCGGATQ